MSVSVCLPIPIPPGQPRLSIPGLGYFEVAKDALYSIPDPTKYMMSMQDLATVALAPVRRFLELVEVILLIQQCVTSVIDCLLPPSPGPLINCLKKLGEAIVRLAALFPPISYIHCLCDILEYCINVIDAIFDFFHVLDERITELRGNLAMALSLGDVELASITDCAGKEVGALTLNAMHLLRGITALLGIIVGSIARMVPSPDMQKAAKEIAAFPETLVNIQDAIANAEGAPVLDDAVETMLIMRRLLINMHTLLASIVGRPRIRSAAPVTDYQNF